MSPGTVFKPPPTTAVRTTADTSSARAQRLNICKQAANKKYIQGKLK